MYNVNVNRIKLNKIYFLQDGYVKLGHVILKYSNWIKKKLEKTLQTIKKITFKWTVAFNVVVVVVLWKPKNKFSKFHSYQHETI